MRQISRILLFLLGMGGAPDGVSGMNSLGTAMDVLGTADTVVSNLDSVVLSFDSVLVNEQVEFLYQRILDEVETMAEDAEDSETAFDDFEALLEEYEHLREQPININSGEVDRLGELGLLNSFQVEALIRYQKLYGDLLFVEELLMVEGFDKRVVAVIAPIVCFGKNDWTQEQEKFTIGKAVKKGKHTLTLNYAQQLNEDQPYEAVSDSLMLAKPNAYYLGNPMKIQVKYRYSYGNKLRLGFVMEKDAGEPFSFTRWSDTIQRLTHGYRQPGFDFYGAYLYLTDWEIIKGREDKTAGHGLVISDLALGDYQLSFGQGLTLWSGMSFGKSGGGNTVMKRGAGVRPKASASEGKFFRGAAATLRYHDLYATGFYSLRWVDATMITDDTLNESVSALQETGYHRTLGELAKRHTLREEVYGGHLSYSTSELELGYTLYHIRLGAALCLNPTKYNQYFFQGDRLTNMGFDFRWQLNKAVFFGEISMSDNRAFAGLAGTTIKPAGYIDFTLLYRNYGTQYQNLLLSAVKESSRGQAEEGYYLSLQCTPAPRWSLLGSCDYFRFKWLSSQVYNPSWGQEYSLKLLHQLSQTATIQVKLKSKTKMKNSADDHVFSHYPIFYTKRTMQLLLNYSFWDDWFFSNDVSYSFYFNDDGAESRGYLLCQDIAYKPEGKPYSITFRYALFASDDYQSRISIYENDVLGAFSIPSLYGRGSRVYLLGKLKLFGTLSLYARIGCTFYDEETKADLKVEAVGKF